MDARGYMGLLRELYVPDGFGPLGPKIRLIDAVQGRLEGLDGKDSLMLHISLPIGLVPSGPEARHEIEVIRAQETLLEEMKREGTISELEYREEEVEKTPGVVIKASYADFETNPHALGIRLKELRAVFIAEADKEAAKQPISLKDQDIEFNDAHATIRVGTRVCRMPLGQNEHALARCIFRAGLDAPVEAIDIYEEMTGNGMERIKDSKKALKAAQDTMYALNDRVKRDINTPDSLLVWKNKTIASTWA